MDLDKKKFVGTGIVGWSSGANSAFGLRSAQYSLQLTGKSHVARSSQDFSSNGIRQHHGIGNICLSYVIALTLNRGCMVASFRIFTHKNKRHLQRATLSSYHLSLGPYHRTTIPDHRTLVYTVRWYGGITVVLWWCGGITVVRWYYGGDTVVLRCYYGGTSIMVVLRWYYCGITVVLRWWYGGIMVVVWWYYGGITVVLRWYYGGIILVWRWYYGGFTVVRRWYYGGITVLIGVPCFRDIVTVIPW